MIDGKWHKKWYDFGGYKFEVWRRPSNDMAGLHEAVDAYIKGENPLYRVRKLLIAVGASRLGQAVTDVRVGDREILFRAVTIAGYLRDGISEMVFVARYGEETLSFTSGAAFGNNPREAMMYFQGIMTRGQGVCAVVSVTVGDLRAAGMEVRRSPAPGEKRPLGCCAVAHCSVAPRGRYESNNKVVDWSVNGAEGERATKELCRSGRVRVYRV